ncbi:MAG: glycoside hydrolase family 3 N-terminal domain-containing protein, partial [Myxococcota bacterium]
MNSTTLVPAWAGLVIAVAGSAACAGSSCAGETKTASPDAPALIHPEAWPLQTSPVGRSPVLEARLAQVLGRMSVEDKVAQIIQADIGSVTPEDVRRYRLGSILNGGNSAPEGDVRAPPEAWLALADAFWEASMDRSDGRVAIPIIWGTDAVHGHDVLGASVFPHNIGLGAAHDPDLVRDIGRATAREIRSTGIEWNFAPTLAVAQDDRWGRTYESYSEDPRVVAEYASAMVTGLQGAPGAPDFLGAERVLATPKHFMGDGGTAGGRDQGDNQASEEVYRDVHGAGYYPAIGSGAQSIMASFNSYRGRKLHGFRPMLNDVLVGRMGFDGFVVGDWNGHGQVEGCSPQNCPASLNAGVDMYMAPGTWKPLYENTL